MRWRRTGDKEFPENGAECLIFFALTGYSVSTFERINDLELAEAIGVDEYVTDVFYDKGGFLGDEDLLWMPIEEYIVSILAYPYPTDAYIADYPECKERLKKF